MELKKCYQCLGIAENADEVVIRAAYRALTQKYHPDKWLGDKEEAHQKMVDINEAYSYLVGLKKLTDSPVDSKSKKYSESFKKNSSQEKSHKTKEPELKDLSIGGKIFVFVGSMLLFGLVAGVIKVVIHYINGRYS